MKKALKIFTVAVILSFCMPFLITAWQLASYYNLIPQRSYTAENFGIETVIAATDFDADGVDDYTEILLGARKDAKNHPRYDGSYVQGGYPDDDVGVCTDVVWRAFREAGYSLKLMVDRDIMHSPQDYPRVTQRDSNIDFRRVVNLRVFFDKYASEITTDTTDISRWQPGDIVIFKDNKHIGIVSDKRNKDGQCYIIHNGGQPVREEYYFERGEVLRHYRFDATKIPRDILIPWEGEQ